MLIIDCGVPPIIPNGKIRIINDKTTFGSTAKLECNDKYASNMAYITCLASGHWENARCLRQGEKFLMFIYLFFCLSFFSRIIKSTSVETVCLN